MRAGSEALRRAAEVRLPRLSRFRTAGRVVAAVMLAAVMSLVASQAAHAAFPGGNGKIAYAAYGDYRNDIWVIEPDGTGRTNLTNGTINDSSADSPAWSADGARLAFIRAGLWIMNADGTGAEQIATPYGLSSQTHVSWSPDGTRIAFTAYAGDPYMHDVFVINADGTGLQNITGTPADDDDWASWSPDGSAITFRSSVGGVGADIYTIAPDGSSRRNLTNTDGVVEIQPSWSPDGRQIVFADNSGHIHRMRSDGTVRVQLSPDGNGDIEPTWSPDGTKIAFSNQVFDGYRLRLVVFTMSSLDGSGRTPLTPSDHADGARYPDWQPFGPAPVSDSTDPAAVLTTPPPNAQYSLGQSVQAAFSCTDEAGGSGVVSCAGAVDGTAVADGAPVPTDVAGSHTFRVTATDGAANTSSTTHTYEVVAGSTSRDIAPGDTVTTDPGGVGATADVPVQTAVTVPAGVSGTLAISLRDTSASSPSGYSYFGKEVELSGPAASAGAPYQVTFGVDASLLGGVAPADLQVFRNGTAVPGCRDAVAAVPDPCVARREVGAGGDAIIVVRTSAFSRWNVGALRYSVSPLAAPLLSPPSVNSASAGAAVSLRFSLGADRGLAVFAPDFPRSAAYVCGGTPPSPSAGVVTSGLLAYDRKKGTYTYTWKTTKTMKGCRQIVLRFKDGTVRIALFNLR